MFTGRSDCGTSSISRRKRLAWAIWSLANIMRQTFGRDWSFHTPMPSAPLPSVGQTSIRTMWAIDAYYFRKQLEKWGGKLVIAKWLQDQQPLSSHCLSCITPLRLPSCCVFGNIKRCPPIIISERRTVHLLQIPLSILRVASDVIIGARTLLCTPSAGWPGRTQFPCRPTATSEIESPIALSWWAAFWCCIKPVALCP
jgi:hypothetical protein